MASEWKNNNSTSQLEIVTSQAAYEILLNNIE